MKLKQQIKDWALFILYASCFNIAIIVYGNYLKNGIYPKWYWVISLFSLIHIIGYIYYSQWFCLTLQQESGK